MGKLQEIKDEVAQEWGHTDWNDFGESFKHRLGSAHAERDDVMTEIALRFAKVVAEDVLKRAADNAHITMVVPDGTDLEKLGTDGLNITVGEVDNYKIRISKESILSTEINLDL